MALETQQASGQTEDVVRCCKLALAANTDRYTDRLMVVQTEHVQYPKECKTPAVLGRSGEITESEHLVERRQQELEPTLLPFSVVSPHTRYVTCQTIHITPPHISQPMSMIDEQCN